MVNWIVDVTLYTGVCYKIAAVVNTEGWVDVYTAMYAAIIFHQVSHKRVLVKLFCRGTERQAVFFIHLIKNCDKYIKSLLQRFNV